MVGNTFFAGVALLTLVAPFELTSPLLRLPRQSVSNLEAAIVSAFVGAALAVRRHPSRTRVADAADDAVAAAARRDGRRVRRCRRCPASTRST